MDNKIQLFNYKGKDVRAIWLEEKQDWIYPLVDICECAGIENSRNVVKRLRPKGVHTVDVLSDGGMQATTCISLSNCFLALMQSRKPEAEPFQDWVCEEVLPAIFETGSYSIHGDFEFLESLTKPHTAQEYVRILHAKIIEQAMETEDPVDIAMALLVLRENDDLFGELKRDFEGHIKTKHPGAYIRGRRGGVMPFPLFNGKIYKQQNMNFNIKEEPNETEEDA